jgi:hypothetical protein
VPLEGQKGVQDAVALRRAVPPGPEADVAVDAPVGRRVAHGPDGRGVAHAAARRRERSRGLLGGVLDGRDDEVGQHLPVLGAQAGDEDGGREEAERRADGVFHRRRLLDLAGLRGQRLHGSLGFKRLGVATEGTEVVVGVLLGFRYEPLLEATCPSAARRHFRTFGFWRKRHGPTSFKIATVPFSSTYFERKQTDN